MLFLFILAIWSWRVWGRKDPMLPGNGIGDTDKTCYPGSPEYKFKYGSEGLNTADIKEYIRNPHKFNTKPEMDGRYYNLWSTDNDKTVPNDDVVIKSVYDPSPVGYSLPASNAFTGFTTTGGNIGDWSNPVTDEQINAKFPFYRGWYFYTAPNKKGILMFILAAGERVDKGGLNVFFAHGGYWFAYPYSDAFGHYLFFRGNVVNPCIGNWRNYGFTVRSAEERETHKFNIKQEMDNRYYNLWSADNNKREPNDDVVIKSVYDPSPVGYSLPASNAFTGFTTTGQNVGYWSTPLTPEERAKFNVKGDFDNGWHFYTKPNKQGNTFFFPASGYRDYNTSSLGLVTTNGYYWVAGPNNRNFGRGLGFHSGNVYPLDYSDRSYGFPVRSAEEKCVGMVKIPD